MSRPARPRSGIAWVIAGMVASIIAIEGWLDVGIVVLAFVLITLWAYPVRLAALLQRMLPFAAFSLITFTFGALGGAPRGPSAALEPMTAAAISRAGLAAAVLAPRGRCRFVGWALHGHRKHDGISSPAGAAHQEDRAGRDAAAPIVRGSRSAFSR